jgi:hypothetical protein
MIDKPVDPLSSGDKRNDKSRLFRLVNRFATAS